MQAFTTLSGVAVPLLIDDVNTDQIAPVSPESRQLSPDHTKAFFSRWRRLADGGADPEFALNKPQFRDARILVVGKNFGCGSSREGAVWAMAPIRCVVARSFAYTFRENCLKNGVLPVTLSEENAAIFEASVIAVNGTSAFCVDLQSGQIVGPDAQVYSFDLPASERAALLEGLDDIGLTLKHDDDIARWERETARDAPWLQRSAPHPQHS